MFWVRTILIIHYMPWIIGLGAMALGAWLTYRGVLGMLDRWAAARVEREAELADLRWRAEQENRAWLRDERDMFGAYDPYTMPLTSPRAYSEWYDYDQTGRI
jgi:hypothetical protein